MTAVEFGAGRGGNAKGASDPDSRPTFRLARVTWPDGISRFYDPGSDAA